MENFKQSRRNFLKVSGGAIVRIGLPGTFAALTLEEKKAVAKESRPDGKPRIPPGQHPIKTLRDMGGQAGPGFHSDWQFRISGEVEKETTLTWEDLMQMPQTDLVCDVHCVTGWTLLDARWQGVRLKDLMKAVNVTKKAGFVIFEAYQGYTSNIPMKEAKKRNVILAHSFSGRPLPSAHGAPLRALVPDRYFYKSAKWLEGIKFSTVDEPGYWESGAFNNSADPWKEERFRE